MDQKTLDALLAKVIAQARQAGIPVSPAIDPKVRVNRRARTRFGCCIQKNGRFYIELASQRSPPGSRRCARYWPTRYSTPAGAAPTTG